MWNWICLQGFPRRLFSIWWNAFMSIDEKDSEIFQCATVLTASFSSSMAKGSAKKLNSISQSIETYSHFIQTMKYFSLSGVQLCIRSSCYNFQRSFHQLVEAAELHWQTDLFYIVSAIYPGFHQLIWLVTPPPSSWAAKWMATIPLYLYHRPFELSNFWWLYAFT